MAKATNLRDAKEQARHKQYPSAPPGVSLDENLEFAKSQKAYFSIKGRGFLLSWFYTQVRNKGEWDYKKGQPQYESFGNFNYGAVGTAAGISVAHSRPACNGAAQISTGTLGWPRARPARMARPPISSAPEKAICCGLSSFPNADALARADN